MTAYAACRKLGIRPAEWRALHPFDRQLLVDGLVEELSQGRERPLSQPDGIGEDDDLGRFGLTVQAV